MSKTTFWWKYIPSFRILLVISAALRIVLILYSEWHDAHSAVKYTDVDYRVFSDAARFLLKPNATQGNVGKGPLMAWLGLQIGSPYTRETYRYTPLLAVLLLPNGFLLSFGKYLFAACDLVNGILIYRTLKTFILPSPDSAPASRQEKPMEESNCGVNNLQNGVISQHDAVATFLAGTHLLNPLVFSISTRGSSESILCTFVLLTLHLALKRRWNMAAILLGVSTHWKIYPFIYGASCVAVVSSETRRVGRDTSPLQALISKSTIRFAIVSASTFFALGGLCYAVWGIPFLQEAFLYHTHRLDHRHNFSPFFYLTYLTYPGQAGSDSLSLPLWHRLLRSPLASLVPQLTLSIGVGLLFGSQLTDLPFAWFVQTYAFVLLNRVCTSQYFLWYTLFLPLLAPRVRFSWLCGAVWAGTQALWLGEAYNLEFLGRNVFFGLWLKGLVYLSGHAWVLGNIIDGYSRGST